jgi:hypothetical protein
MPRVGDIQTLDAAESNTVPVPAMADRYGLGVMLSGWSDAGQPGSPVTPDNFVVLRHSPRGLSRVECLPIQRGGFQGLP